MLIKARGVPIWIQCLEALLRLLPQNHRLVPEIHRNLKNRRKGYNGEKSSDYYASLLDQKEFLILHDLTLFHKKLHFQIDTLILTTRFFLIIEIKSLEGELFFNHMTCQLTVSRHETVTGTDNPLIQALNHCTQLRGWLETHKLKQMPIEHLAIISNSRSVIRCSNYETARHVGTDKSLPLKVMELSKRYKEELFTDKELKKIAKAFKKAHSPQPINIMGFYKLKREELLKYIACPNCGCRPMVRVRGLWHCEKCFAYSKDAHVEVITDHLLVKGNRITNKECRDLLGISSVKLANKLLTGMNLHKEGNTRNRSYSLKLPSHLK
ncbi:nuclease-related domain-containing protein [Neobacillus sp. YIM B06451]|uniref:nuclease-related domain-containing protein n=1 Tax=Neobacillus sp. YIM B06451 TaxID=3070994 RepID=UPI00292EF819|nr:nuclease-related domain-containing protein [Neobacillus sp. YIM B06451]